VSTGVDKKANLRGGGALEAGNLCILEDGGERGGVLETDLVCSETASEWRRGRGKRVSMSTGIARKANAQANGAPQRGHGASLEPLAQLGYALRGVGALAVHVEAAEPVFTQAAKGRSVVSRGGADRNANTRGRWRT